jgi:tetratricopeptide (TPR) repeat protein
LSFQADNWRCRSLLASVLESSGNHGAAEEQFRLVSQINPTWQESANQEAWTRATNPDPKKRNGNYAVLLALEICQATNRQEPRFLDTLAAAYAEVGQFPRAVETAQEAVAAIPPGQQGDLLRSLTERLNGYQKSRPYRAAVDAAMK